MPLLPHRFVLSLCCVFVAGQSRAAVVLPVTLPELARKADIIFHGTVTAADERSGVKGAQTHLEFAVHDALKGLSGASFSFDLPGGRFANQQVLLFGLPHFSAGDEVVVLLHRNKDGSYALLGLGQGLFRVHHAGNTATVSGEFSGEGTGKNIAAALTRPKLLQDLLWSLAANCDP